MAAPSTQKGQLDAFFQALGIKDENFEGAIAHITALTTGAETAQTLQTQLKAFFDLAGITAPADQAKAIDVLTAIKSDRDALFKALGDSPDVTSAIGVIQNMQNDRNAIWKALGATDHSTALAAVTASNDRVTKAEAAQKDFDARLKKGIDDGVIARAAEAGLPAPVPKKAEGAEVRGAEKAVSPRRRLGALFNEQIENK
jgi:hypothetical protein